MDMKKNKLISRRLLFSQSSAFLLFGCMQGSQLENIRGGYKKRYLPRGDKTSSLRGSSIALTVGHGYHESGSFDPGATSDDKIEFDLNLFEAERLAEKLSAFGARVDIFAYKESSSGVSLAERGRNVANHDIHLSMHHNAYRDTSVQGGEVLVSSVNATDEDKILAGLIADQLSMATGFENRGVKQRNLGVLRESPRELVKCLTEPYFLSHDELSLDMAWGKCLEAADAMAVAIEAYWLGRSDSSFNQLSLVQGLSKAESSAAAKRGELEILDSLTTMTPSNVLVNQLSRDVPEVSENDLPGLYDDH